MSNMPPQGPSWANAVPPPTPVSISTTTATNGFPGQQHHSFSTTATPNNSGVHTHKNIPTADSYFTETRKGEVNELRLLLRDFGTEKDPVRKREIMKKVIAYMTLGIDVSRLFTEMMLAIETRDLVIKKMVYMYLSNYATSHPELAQMCTNTLQKDCGNDDPMVRGLALRSLCSLRLPEMVEYIVEPLRRSLSDSHAYVRKTAVMGTLKLYHLDPTAFERTNFVNILYDMLRDTDASVVVNCILVLNEVMAKGPNGGMAINRAIILHLLNRIREFSEFGVVAVLDLVSRYIPANEEEGYQIMNLLDPILRTSNTSAFMAVLKVFLTLSDCISEKGTSSESIVVMRNQIVSRIKAPIVTMMSGGSHELSYVLLKHIDSLIDIAPGVFDDEYRQFYIRYNEPTHVKYLKVSIIAKVTNPSNAPDIVAELSECIASTDPLLSRLSVRSMARIACRNVGGDGCAESIARRLVELLDLDIAHVNAEAATALASMLRQHHSLRGIIAPPLPRAVKFVTEPRGKASLLHLLAECGDIVKEAPYSVEKLIDSYDTIKSPDVKISLLTNTMKLFFKRAPEVQRMLGRLLAKATADVSSQDLHDRALLYYRLLRTSIDPSILEGIVTAKQDSSASFKFAEEDIDDDIRDDLMKEFNTFSTIYGTTSENFIAEEYQVKFVKMPSEHPLDAHVIAQGEQLVVSQEYIPSQPSQVVTLAATAPANDIAPIIKEMDLLGFSDEIPTTPVTRSISSNSHLSLDPSFSITGDEYQSIWASVPDSSAFITCFLLREQPLSTDVVENALLTSSIMTMASGELPSELKFFLYARNTLSNAVILVQCIITKERPDVQCSLTVKMDGSGGSENFGQVLETFKGALNLFI